MWKVEYRDKDGQQVIWPTDFHTRKAARLWCKKCRKRNMTLIAPNGDRESFIDGV